ncbi:TrkA C-terminal domain-containing protein [Helicobacter kayseriensis]|uniref:TrkA C-terminal domain-containing protein n=1 Tax=Helicobacter kayseriensis TaxID=2905877 RepID=UPI001E51EB4B|nr:TrkA C-terminal domain-containing protein [Helicobacter kayseriensis]MCE3047448.1 hypothetical protein [Helicobacter kayseriensis]MCE3048819.1 hypothetical protein [Helicobacter kayseriensis]
MKQIALILEGKCAQFFLDKLLLSFHSSNFYTVITPNPDLIPPSYPDNFSFYCFDPSSKPKIQRTLAFDLDLIFLVFEDFQECQMTYSTIRDLFPLAHIIFHSTQSLEIQDPLLEEISSPLLASNKLLTYLPNIPTPIQDLGLGKGEVMEIPIPSGSVYCYRTIGSISQKEWKIAGVYRGEELLLGTYSLSLQPNDRLLAIGNPSILQNVYRQITSSLGQFPIPFGKDLFLYLDEDLQNENEILQDIGEALFLHKHLNCNQLIITLLNPKRFDLINHIKCIQDEHINVYIDYSTQKLTEILQNHHKKRIGLAIMHYKFFHSLEIKKTLFELSIPTFKTSQVSIQDCHSSLSFLEEDQNIASITLDIASQLQLDFELYDFDVDGHFHTESFKTYKNLSQIFNKPIHLIKSNTKNPVIYLLELEKPILQFLPLNLASISNTISGALSTQLTFHALKLNKYPQILIPIS